GSSAYTLRLAEGLAREGISAPVVATDARRVPPQVSKRLQIQEFRRLDAPLWGALVFRTLLNDLRRRPPHLIHIQSQRALRQGMRLARSLQTPYVLTIHEHLSEGAQPRLDRTF